MQPTEYPMVDPMLSRMGAQNEWFEMPLAAAPSTVHPLATIRQVTDSVGNTIGNLTDQVVQQASEQVQKSLMDQTLRKAETLGSNVIDSFLERAREALEAWGQQHPIANWLLTHPILSAIALLLVISLAFTLITSLGRLLQQTWLAVLKAPVVALLWVGRWLLQQTQGAIAQPKRSPTEPQEDRVTHILVRLEHIRQEQDALMQELKLLLGQPQEERAKEPR